ncbi:penicillin-binding protein 1C [Ideonella sp. DXS22W]|uniref:peptidoglycan glycosyltransferase n=1 Tax=Pseudaquabacterium inlustre TaxID=2984192 RepID=A0ABU9CPX7_9BURK
MSRWPPRRWPAALLLAGACAAQAGAGQGASRAPAAAVAPAASASAAHPAASGDAAALPTFTQVRAAWRPSDATLLDRQGRVLAMRRLDAQGRRLDWVALDEVSPALVSAVLAAEDQRFFSHGGVDWLSAAGAAAQAGLRAVAPSLASAGPVRGASSIPMQLAALLQPDLARDGGPRSVAAKWRQMQAAQALAARWSAPQMLEAYLNRVGFRGELQGIGAASWGLFGKAPSGLDRFEAALLAVLIRQPNAAPALAARRACALAARLPDTGHCDADGLTLALQQPAARAPVPALAPHAAQRLLTADAAPRVHSSLDADVQRLARDALSAQLATLAGQGAEDAAAVVLDNASGEVLAYVGSSGPAFSRAALVDAASAPRQAGSTLKPFLYALAFEQQHLTAATLLDDSPLALATDAGLYTPRNYDLQHAGPVSARRALASSMNVPAVRTVLLTGVPDLLQRLRRLGLDTLDGPSERYGPALALGAADVTLLQLTNAYRTLANGGLASPVRWSPPDTAHPAGATVQSQRVIDASSAWLVADILSDNRARAATFGHDSVLATPVWAAVKTGTSKDMRDNWCIGFSQRYTVGVWVGNAAGTPMRAVSGVSGAAPAWAEILRGLHRTLPSRQPAPPAGLVARRVVFEAGVAEAGRTEWFLPGTVPPAATGAAGAAITVTLAPPPGRPRITQPPDGSLIAWDPDIPPALHGLLAVADGLTGTPDAAQGWLWRLDDQALPDSGVRARVPLATLPAGHHRLQLLDANGALLDEVRFELRAPPVRAAQAAPN